MSDSAIRRPLSKWTPTTNLMTLRRMGKLLEELGELQAVAARVIIQGIDEVDPGSGKVNRQRLLEEMADVQAQLDCTLEAFFGLEGIIPFSRRVADKVDRMREWEAMFGPVRLGRVQAFMEARCSCLGMPGSDNECKVHGV